MTIYNRPRAEVFAENAPPSEIQPFQAWLRGLGIAFDETNGFPEMTGLNGLFNALNQYIKYLEQNGFAEWSADLEYPIGAGVRVGSVWYRAKTQNTNKPPATSQNDWELFLNASALSYGNPIYIENNVVKVRDASTAQKGVVQFANATEVANKSNVSKSVNPVNAATIAQSTDLGVGQTYQNLTSSRSLGLTYTNNTGKAIFVSIDVRGSSSGVDGIRANVAGAVVSELLNIAENHCAQISFIVPGGASYSVQQTQASINLTKWVELR
ncbi:hypothetical protein [Jeotgalibaca porci]|uniref:hypothetical protein n=1 Tax=Jeotgalibaca porci TaxID=1868793 RepID=UPI00359FC2B5